MTVEKGNSKLVLYGPDGQPLPRDEREGWQREWDRRFRAQMGHNHGVSFPVSWISGLKREFDRRDEARVAAYAGENDDSKSVLDQLAPIFGRK